MDRLNFKFTGQLSDTNRMDFYEAARFQYAAARLSVKLDQFRRTGRFSQRVTTQTKTDIDLHTFVAGSFEMQISAVEDSTNALKIPVPLNALWAYVLERTFQPTETSAALDMIDNNALRAEFFQIIDENVFESDQAIALLRRSLANSGILNPPEKELLDRLISESERRAYLRSHQNLFELISPEQDAAIMTMAAPLVSEMAVPLRRSAKLAEISLIEAGRRHSILVADRAMAESIESIRIDKTVSSIDINVVQYNKESGWGKFRNRLWSGIPSFNLPADRKSRMKFDIVRAMREEKVSATGYIVRSAGGEPIRLILVDIDLIDEI